MRCLYILLTTVLSSVGASSLVIPSFEEALSKRSEYAPQYIIHGRSLAARADRGRSPSPSRSNDSGGSQRSQPDSPRAAGRRADAAERDAKAARLAFRNTARQAHQTMLATHAALGVAAVHGVQLSPAEIIGSQRGMLPGLQDSANAQSALSGAYGKAARASTKAGRTGRAERNNLKAAASKKYSEALSTKFQNTNHLLDIEAHEAQLQSLTQSHGPDHPRTRGARDARAASQSEYERSKEHLQPLSAQTERLRRNGGRDSDSSDAE